METKIKHYERKLSKAYHWVMRKVSKFPFGERTLYDPDVDQYFTMDNLSQIMSEMEVVFHDHHSPRTNQ